MEASPPLASPGSRSIPPVSFFTRRPIPASGARASTPGRHGFASLLRADAVVGAVPAPALHFGCAPREGLRGWHSVVRASSGCRPHQRGRGVLRRGSGGESGREAVGEGGGGAPLRGRRAGGGRFGRASESVALLAEARRAVRRDEDPGERVAGGAAGGGGGGVGEGRVGRTARSVPADARGALGTGPAAGAPPRGGGEGSRAESAAQAAPGGPRSDPSRAAGREGRRPGSPEGGDPPTSPAGQRWNGGAPDRRESARRGGSADRDRRQRARPGSLRRGGRLGRPDAARPRAREGARGDARRRRRYTTSLPD